MTETAQDFFQRGIAAAQAGDLAAAESLLRQCIALDPKNALAMLNLGVVLMNRGNSAAAEQMLFQSVNTQATVESISTLANVLELNGKPAEAERCYGVILNAVPNHPPALAKLAELADAEGDRKKAREWYRKLWEADPANFSAGTAYAINSFSDDPAETSRVFERLMEQTKNDDGAQSKVLMTLLPYREFHERIKRGLMPYHGTDLNELFFKFARGDFNSFRQLILDQAARNPGDLKNLRRKFLAHFCAGEFEQAANALSALPETQKGGILGAVVFDLNFLEHRADSLDAEIASNLPPLEKILSENFSGGDVIFLSCNSGYFDSFGEPLIRSLATRKPGARVHLHIVDAAESRRSEIAGLLKRLPLQAALSAEQTEFRDQESQEARDYYHCIRFVRFYQWLKTYDVPLWLMDVDALFNQQPDRMFAALAGSDMALRIRPGRLEPWHQFSACIVGARQTAAGMRYFRLVAAYIVWLRQERKLSWGIDQLALFIAFMHLRRLQAEPRAAYIDGTIADLDSTQDGVVWLTAGKSKFLLAKQSSEEPAKERYRELFNRYRDTGKV